MAGVHVTCCMGALNRVPIDVHQVDPPGGKVRRDIAIGKKEKFAGVVENGGDITRDEAFILAKSDDRRRGPIAPRQSYSDLSRRESRVNIHR